jgi:hypothetical protein
LFEANAAADNIYSRINKHQIEPQVSAAIRLPTTILVRKIRLPGGATESGPMLLISLRFSMSRRHFRGLKSIFSADVSGNAICGLLLCE